MRMCAHEVSISENVKTCYMHIRVRARICKLTRRLKRKSKEVKQSGTRTREANEHLERRGEADALSSGSTLRCRFNMFAHIQNTEHTLLEEECREAGDALGWKQAGRNTEEEVREARESWRQSREEV